MYKTGISRQVALNMGSFAFKFGLLSSPSHVTFKVKIFQRPVNMPHTKK